MLEAKRGQDRYVLLTEVPLVPQGLVEKHMVAQVKRQRRQLETIMPCRKNQPG